MLFIFIFVHILLNELTEWQQHLPDLPHPLVLDGRDLAVRVAHHGDEEVDEEDGGHGAEDEKGRLAEDLPGPLAVPEVVPEPAERAHGHDEDLHGALHRALHRVLPGLVAERLEDDVVG